MQLMQLLHKTLAKELPSIHKSRLQNLIMDAFALINPEFCFASPYLQNSSKNLKSFI